MQIIGTAIPIIIIDIVIVIIVVSRRRHRRCHTSGGYVTRGYTVYGITLNALQMSRVKLNHRLRMSPEVYEYRERVLNNTLTISGYLCIANFLEKEQIYKACASVIYNTSRNLRERR